MKALKTGYVFVLIFLLVYAVTLGIASFYPIPKRLDYPQYPSSSVTDTNSPQYQQAQKKYETDLKAYQENNKDNETNRKIWGENVYIICLITAVIFLIVGVLLSFLSPLMGAGFLFAGLILILGGQGIATYQADSGSIPLLGQSPKIDITSYKQKQFYIIVVGVISAIILGVTKFIKNQTIPSATVQ